MNLTNLFKIAFKALSNNKLRGFLTMLGIIIGVGSVITMLAIGQGSKRSIQAQISEMGSNMIMIHPGGDRRGGVRLDAADMESLKLKDLEAIQTQARYISYISPSVNSSGQAIFGANNTPTTVYGISPEYLDIRRYKVEEGDIFSEQDVKTAAKVCLVGKSVVDELFPDGESPVGKVIRFGKIPLRIVGVLESKGYNSMGMDQDDLILAPYTTVQKRILAITHLQSITCSALSEEYTDQAIEEINAARVGLLSPDIVEEDTGIAEVRETFKVPKVGTIAGCYIVEGEIHRDDKVRIVRDGTIIFEGVMESLRRFKDDVKSVKQGYECGIGIEKFQDLKIGDHIEGYTVKEVERTE